MDIPIRRGPSRPNRHQLVGGPWCGYEFDETEGCIVHVQGDDDDGFWVTTAPVGFKVELLEPSVLRVEQGGRMSLFDLMSDPVRWQHRSGSYRDL